MAKKKKQTEQDIREKLADTQARDIMEEEDLDTEVKAKEEAPPEAPVSSAKVVMKLQADVEKITAELEVFKQFRTMNEEKFHQLSEEIGELRSTLLEKEKKIGEFEAKTARVYDMVEAVQPEELMKNVQKLDARIETSDATIKKDEKLLTNLTTELRDIRSAIAVFKNTERLVKLNTEIGTQLSNIEKVQTKIDRQSSKVEDMFIEMGKRTSKYEVLFDTVGSLENAFKDIVRGFDEVEIGYKNFVQEKDFGKFKKDVQDAIDVEKKNFLKLKEDAQLQLENANQFLTVLEEKEESFDKQSYLLLDEARASLKKVVEKQQAYDKVLTQLDSFEKKVMEFGKSLSGAEAFATKQVNLAKDEVQSASSVLRAEIARSGEELDSRYAKKVSSIQTRLDEENTDIRTQLKQHLEDLKSIKNTIPQIAEQRELLDKCLGDLEKLSQSSGGRLTKVETSVGDINATLKKLPEYNKRINIANQKIEGLRTELKRIDEFRKVLDKQKETFHNLQLDVVSRVENCEVKIGTVDEVKKTLENYRKDIAAMQKDLSKKITTVQKENTKNTQLINRLQNIEENLAKYEREFAQTGTTIERLNTLENKVSEAEQETSKIISELNVQVGSLEDVHPRLNEDEKKLIGLETYMNDVLKGFTKQTDKLKKFDSLEEKVTNSEKEILIFIQDSKNTLIEMEKEKNNLQKVVDEILGNQQVIEEFKGEEVELRQRISDVEKKSGEVLNNIAKANKNIHDKELKWEAVLEENRKLIEELRQERDRIRAVRDNIKEEIEGESRDVIEGIVRESTSVTQTLMGEVDEKHKQFLNTLAEIQKKMDENAKEREENLLALIDARSEEGTERIDILAQKHTEEQKKILEQTKDMITKLVDAEKTLQEKREKLESSLASEANRYNQLEKSVNNLLTVVNNVISYPNRTLVPTQKCEHCGKESKTFWVCTKCGKKVCENCARTYKKNIYCVKCLEEAVKILKYKQKGAQVSSQ